MTDFQSPQPAHTPGPWQCLQAGDGPTKFAVADAEGLSILTIVEEEGHDFAAVYCDEDARLIAAAPELLEALTECMRALRMLGHTDVVGYALAELAIAKVTGAQA